MSEMVWPVGTDPVSQAALWVPNRLYPWQASVLRDCAVQGSRVSCVTPNESGKTSIVIPALGLAWMAAWPGAQVVSTAGVERQIHEQLWPVLRGILRKYPRWSITDDLKVTAPEVNGVPGATWSAFTTKDPAYAEGFHPRTYKDQSGKKVYAPLLIIIDEAKSFDDPAMMFAFVKRCSPDALLMISTPGEDAGPFYDSFHRERGKPWKCHEITWEDCPHLRVGFKLQEREETIERLGENHPLVLSWIFGKFYRRGARYIFDNMEDVEIAMGGRVRHLRGSRCLAIDFSDGGDEQTIGFREGNKIHPIEVFHEKDAVRFCDIVVGLTRKWFVSPDEMVGDAGGSGKTYIDILESRLGSGIRRYRFNADPRDKVAFRYRGIEDHYNVRDRLRWRSLILPADDVLKDEIRKRRYEVLNDDNRLALEPKEKVRNRGESSPNRLDNVVMLCSDMETMGVDVGPTSVKAATRCPDFQECFVRKAGEEGNSDLGWASGMMMDE